MTRRLALALALTTAPEPEPGPHPEPDPSVSRCERQLVRAEERVTGLLAERPAATMSMWEQARRRVYYVQR